MKTRAFVAAGLLIAVLVATLVSFYASSHPDGLEYVADRTGFLDTADEHAVAEGPLADYGVQGVDDARLSGGLAGAIGAVVTLGLTGALVLVVRRRRPEA